MNMPAWDNTKQNDFLPPETATESGEGPIFLIAGTATYYVEPEDNLARDNFLQLSEQWKNETGHSSKMMYKFMNKNYQQIIAMGDSVVPMLLDALITSPGHWFWALEVITGENPVKQEHAGYFDSMTRDWIEWGIDEGRISV